MDLRKATAAVLTDALNDNNGNIGYEVAELSDVRKRRLVIGMMDSDEFLQDLTDALEGTIMDHLDNYADEYGL